MFSVEVAVAGSYGGGFVVVFLVFIVAVVVVASRVFEVAATSEHTDAADKLQLVAAQLLVVRVMMQSGVQRVIQVQWVHDGFYAEYVTCLLGRKRGRGLRGKK